MAAYAALYYAIEHRRASKGPWEVTFTESESGAPAILINQTALGITNIQVSFAGAEASLTNATVKLTFAQARKTPFDVPYGRCVFLDTVSLPGTVVLEMFGHQIQLMPRVLTIDGVERPWNSGETICLTNKQAPEKDGG